ncbi:MAG: 5'/3'-nucleotidase SurE [Oscillospiraceae bacterium]|nr:5'/3'-nucleotidase SurE [Oscillospiraceae bacterium]
MKKILIVNDDGIDSEGIIRLADIARHFGTVYVVAPDHQCSGMSQKISIFDKILVRNVDFPVSVEGAWSVGGTPADCVKTAVNSLLSTPPDYVFSGINNGFNTGFDTVYSGTVGAAMEARMKGIPSAAFSNRFSGVFDTAEHYLPLLIEEIFSLSLLPCEVWNINFPGITLGECRGVQYGCTVAPFQLYEDHYIRDNLSTDSFTLRNASVPLTHNMAPEGSDVSAVLSDYISVGKLRCPVL